MMTLNHGLSGYVCSRVAMPLLKRASPLSERSMAFGFFLGAMLPDGDIVSRLFGRGVYFGDGWYSHRHASHSILGTLILALAAALIIQAVAARWRKGPLETAPVLWLAGCLWAGGLLHIVGDLFTPGWQLMVFWPLPFRFGAWSHIGWFTPYLFWLFISAALLGWGLARLLPRLGLAAPLSGGLVWGIHALATYRWFDFLQSSRYESWSQWLSFHRTLLPDALILPVTEGVRIVWRLLTS